MIEPRKVDHCGADVVNRTEGTIECVASGRTYSTAGVEEQGMFAKGLPGNLGDPARLHECESKAED